MDLRAISSVAHLAIAIATPELVIEAFMKAPTRFLEKVVIKRRRGSKRPREVWKITNHQIKAGLQNLQRELHVFLKEYFPQRYPHPAVHGFVRGSSALTNAAVHAGCKRLVKADVTNFFPSITAVQVEEALLRFDLGPAGAKLIAQVATLRGALAVGYPCSPLISNLVMLERDVRFAELAKQYGAKFTRYSDDISFSSGGSELPSKAEIREILSPSFKLHPRKFTERKDGQSLYVTGYSVNTTSPRAPKALKRRLRAWLQQVKTKGLRSLAKKTGRTIGRLSSEIPGLIGYVAAAEPNLAKIFAEAWSLRSADDAAIKSVPKRSRVPEEVTLVFDDTGFDAHGITYYAIGTARLRNVEACATILDETAGNLRLNPLMTAEARTRLAAKGIHYADLPEDFRRDVVELIVRLPVVGHIVFARARPDIEKKDQVAELLASALRQRLIDCRDKVLSVVFEQGDYVKKQEAPKAVKAAVAAMEPSRRPLKIAGVSVVGKLEDPCVAFPDVIMGAWQQFARSADPERVGMSERDARMFALIQPKVATIYDLDLKILYTAKKNRFTPFPPPPVSPA